MNARTIGIAEGVAAVKKRAAKTLPLDADGVVQLAEALSKGWSRYVHIFGVVPHGTKQQLAALIELSPGVSARVKSEKAVTSAT
jgi:hypothetical protein